LNWQTPGHSTKEKKEWKQEKKDEWLRDKEKLSSNFENHKFMEEKHGVPLDAGESSEC